jgi:hypothetical protein
MVTFILAHRGKLSEAHLAAKGRLEKFAACRNGQLASLRQGKRVPHFGAQLVKGSAVGRKPGSAGMRALSKGIVASLAAPVHSIPCKRCICANSACGTVGDQGARRDSVSEG